MNTLITNEAIENKIHTIRNVAVMIDADLALMYGVETKVLNQAVKRNEERFPKDFMFQLTAVEYDSLRSQIVTSNARGGRRSAPYAFTEQGVAMLSAVLKSKTAIQISIQIINAFVHMRKLFASHDYILKKMHHLEKSQLAYEVQTDERFEKIFNALENTPMEQKQGVFYDGQAFDAYTFISTLIKKATTSLVLIDNYIDESVLTHLSKANKTVQIILLTKKINEQLLLDVKKYEEQHRKIILKPFDLAHDRFLIIDEKEIYHIGASIKDLGKKWFAFSKMESANLSFMEKIRNIIN